MERLGLAIVVVSGFLFGLVIPILICIIPQMWRRMHAKDYFDYHQANGNAGTNPTAPEESHPFLYTNGTSGGGPGNGHLRTTASAVARQFNESPSFQRLAINSSSINSNTTQTTNTNNNNNSVIGGSNMANLATISRNNRFNTMNQPRTNPYATNNNSLAAAAAAANNSLQSYSQTLKLNNTSRLMNDYLHQDPYLLLNAATNSSNNNGFPSAPNAPLPPPPVLPSAASQNGNYFNTNSNHNNIPKPPEYSKYNNSNASATASTYAASNALQSSSIK